jgi:hypothetical protein
VSITTDEAQSKNLYAIAAYVASTTTYPVNTTPLWRLSKPFWAAGSTDVILRHFLEYVGKESTVRALQGVASLVIRHLHEHEDATKTTIAEIIGIEMGYLPVAAGGAGISHGMGIKRKPSFSARTNTGSGMIPGSGMGMNPGMSPAIPSAGAGAGAGAGVGVGVGVGVGMIPKARPSGLGPMPGFGARTETKPGPMPGLGMSHAGAGLGISHSGAGMGAGMSHAGAGMGAGLSHAGAGMGAGLSHAGMGAIGPVYRKQRYAARLRQFMDKEISLEHLRNLTETILEEGKVEKEEVLELMERSGLTRDQIREVFTSRPWGS